MLNDSNGRGQQRLLDVDGVSIRFAACVSLSLFSLEGCLFADEDARRYAR